jgi:hypothetical protein
MIGSQFLTPGFFKVFLAVLSLVGILAGGVALVLDYWNDVYFGCGRGGARLPWPEALSHRREPSAPPIAS